MDKPYVLLRLIPLVVSVVLCLGGIGLAAARWRRRRLLSVLAVVGLPLLLLNSAIVWYGPGYPWFHSNVPLWLVCSAGVVFGLTRCRRHRVVSGLAVAGLLFLALVPIINAFVGEMFGPLRDAVLAALLTLANVMLLTAVFVGKRDGGHRILRGVDHADAQ